MKNPREVLIKIVIYTFIVLFLFATWFPYHAAGLIHN